MSAILLLLLAVATASPKPTCLPPFWRGILAGGTTRSEVARLYGEGVFLPDEKGDPASYYLDRSGAVTLHVVYGTDDLVRTLEIINGNAVPEGSRRNPRLISAYLRPPFVFGGLGALTFGASMEDVRANMGEPVERARGDAESSTFVYHSSCACELASGISFTFRNGHLAKVAFWQDFD